MLGVRELREVIEGTMALGLDAELDLDVSLARGLNYYTGTIIEVKAKDVAIGSISGGGRYDNLTGVFGMGGAVGRGVCHSVPTAFMMCSMRSIFIPPMRALPHR